MHTVIQKEDMHHVVSKCVDKLYIY